MTRLQRLSAELGERRRRLLDIEGMDGAPTERKAEAEALRAQIGTLQSRWDEAHAVESAEEARQLGMLGPGDGESAEVRQLLTRANLGDYMTAAVGGGGIHGAARELNAALGVVEAGASGGAAIPWPLLDPAIRDPRAAFTTTTQNDGSVVDRPILQRLFGVGVAEALGVVFESVAPGRAEFPLLTGGAAPVQTTEGTAAATAAAATFDTAILKPKRLTAAYDISHESIASVADIEEALRRDIMDAARSRMHHVLINGPNNNNANIQGFIAKLGAATDLSTAEATAADYGKLHALAVDGIHASSEMEVKGVIGDESYQHSAGVYISGSGESGSELLARRSGGCMASTYIPNKASMKQSAILHAAGMNGGVPMMRRSSAVAIWAGAGLELIRDPFSKASQGITITAVILWDAAVAIREDAYKHVAINIG